MRKDMRRLAAVLIGVAAILPAGAAMAEDNGNNMRNTWEIQYDSMHPCIFNDRHISNDTVHVYQKMGQRGTISWYRGLTVTDNHGTLTDNDKVKRNSDAWGAGPSVMGRYEHELTGKLYGGLDATGTLMFYNKAFPAGGRGYGFMWRTGPRLTWKSGEKDSFSVGYTIMHCSNGMKSRNPGYNGNGLTVVWSHQF